MKNDIAPDLGGVAAPRKGRGAPLLTAGAILLIGGYLAYSFAERREGDARLAQWTDARAVANVAVVAPHVDSAPQIFSLPGHISAWYEASIYSQVSGYVKDWRTDIGATVKKGDALAEIDTPELDERLAEAREQLSRAQAALELAQVTARRWGALSDSAAVSKQSADEKASDLKVKQAELGAASANLDRLKAQKLFARIVAPYDGVVTARNIDIGSYVAPGHGAEPLFKVADIHAVRVYVNAPQVYAALMRPGLIAQFVTPQWKDRRFEAKVATTSNAIAAGTGSLLVELDAPNPDGALLPGSYADVHFELAADPGQLRIPSSALAIDGRGARVATVDADNRIRFKNVTIAKDFGAEVELASGLSAGDRVVDNPPPTLADGDAVRVAAAPTSDPAGDRTMAPGAASGATK